MRLPSNIDRSKFRWGEYVGYAHGAWRITRLDRRWIARRFDGNCRFTHLSGNTLADVSRLLANVSKDGAVTIPGGRS